MEHGEAAKVSEADVQAAPEAEQNGEAPEEATEEAPKTKRGKGK